MADTLKPCRECGAHCRTEDFPTYCGGPMDTTIWLCSAHKMFGGQCPSDTAYLTEAAWNTRTINDAPDTRADAERDNCQVCSGNNGGVAGNENLVCGVVLCDYCHAAILPITQAWRCFHCGEAFADHKLAEDHFGQTTLHPAACVDPLRDDERAMRERAMFYERSWRQALKERDEARAALSTKEPGQ
jgi:hypothetical protein